MKTNTPRMGPMTPKAGKSQAGVGGGVGCRWEGVPGLIGDVMEREKEEERLIPCGRRKKLEQIGIHNLHFLKIPIFGPELKIAALFAQCSTTELCGEAGTWPPVPWAGARGVVGGGTW